MRPDLERALRTCLAAAEAERSARDALRAALDAGALYRHARIDTTASSVGTPRQMPTTAK